MKHHDIPAFAMLCNFDHKELSYGLSFIHRILGRSHFAIYAVLRFAIFATPYAISIKNAATHARPPFHISILVLQGPVVKWKGRKPNQVASPITPPSQHTRGE